MSTGRRGRPSARLLAAGAFLSVLALGGCTAPSTPGTSSSGSPSPSASPTASPTTSPTTSPTSPTTTATPSTTSPSAPSTTATTVPPPAGFGTATVTGGTSYTGPGQAQLLRVAAGCHAGFDRVVLDFGDLPVPPFTVDPQTGPWFHEDPSDRLVRVRGTSGVRVVVTSTQVRASAAARILPGCVFVREVRRIGDFEAVVSYAVGVQGQARVRVTLLTSPSRLVVDITG